MQILQDKNTGIISQIIDKNVIDAMESFLSDTDLHSVSTAALVLAGVFGNERDFSQLINDDKSLKENAEKKLISSFHNNLQLLVQKTWVEKSDEALKEQVLERLNLCCENVKAIDYVKSYESFNTVLHDVVYLMFGAQAKKDDFSEYALRIDPGFGIFWWYLQNLPQRCTWESYKIRLALLLGMFFLANY
jgi:hypothetical protein